MDNGFEWATLNLFITKRGNDAKDNPPHCKPQFASGIDAVLCAEGVRADQRTADSHHPGGQIAFSTGDRLCFGCRCKWQAGWYRSENDSNPGKQSSVAANRDPRRRRPRGSDSSNYYDA